MGIVSERRRDPEVADRLGEHDGEGRPARRGEQGQHDPSGIAPPAAVHAYRRLEFLSQSPQAPREGEVGEGHALDAEHDDHAERAVEQADGVRRTVARAGRGRPTVRASVPSPARSGRTARGAARTWRRTSSRRPMTFVREHGPRHACADTRGDDSCAQPHQKRVQRTAYQSPAERLPETVEGEPGTSLIQQSRAEGHQQEQRDGKDQDGDDQQPEKQPRAVAESR